MAEIAAYDKALDTGLYQKPGGLLGKYDNVRRFWEDKQLGMYLRPYLERLVARKKECGERLRVLDLGCGGGDGFEFLTSINRSKSSISKHNTVVIEPDMLELYKGIDINEGLLRQAQYMYRHRQNMDFLLADINHGEFLSEPPYDLYLANYGTLSHNTDEQTVKLLSNIASCGKDGTLIIVDWLGRFSYEWQTLWTEQWIDYTISYLPSERSGQQDLTHFLLRLMGRSELQQVYQRVRKKARSTIALRKLADRSSFVGRHMDTAQYNPYCQPLRRLVNSLFEPDVCTNLDELLVHYVPREGFTGVNAYYQRLTDCWNYLVIYTKTLLEQSAPPQALVEMPPPLRRCITTMRKLVMVASSVRIGNPRASVIEPQLAYCLRELEMGLQRGLGCGHGLVAIFEIVK